VGPSPAITATAAQPADPTAYGRRIYLDKAQCSYCHGWAADGSGEPQSNGGAANLRQSFLNRDQLIEVIMCGRPGTPMPHYDELAYTDKRCYGVTEAELGTQRPSPPPTTTLQKPAYNGPNAPMMDVPGPERLPAKYNTSTTLEYEATSGTQTKDWETTSK